MLKNLLQETAPPKSQVARGPNALSRGAQVPRYREADVHPRRDRDRCFPAKAVAVRVWVQGSRRKPLGKSQSVKVSASVVMANRAGNIYPSEYSKELDRVLQCSDYSLFGGLTTYTSSPQPRVPRCPLRSRAHEREILVPTSP